MKQYVSEIKGLSAEMDKLGSVRIHVDASELDTPIKKYEALRELQQKMHDNPALVNTPAYDTLSDILVNAEKEINNIKADEQALANIDQANADAKVAQVQAEVDALMQKKGLIQDISNLNTDDLSQRQSSLMDMKNSLDPNAENYAQQIAYINDLLEQATNRKNQLYSGDVKVGDPVEVENLANSIDNTTQATNNLTNSMSDVANASSSATSQASSDFSNLGQTITQSTGEASSNMEKLDGNSLSNISTSLMDLNNLCEDVTHSAENIQNALNEADGYGNMSLISSLQEEQQEIENTKNFISELGSMTQEEFSGLPEVVRNSLGSFSEEGQKAQQALLGLQQQASHFSSMTFDGCNQQFQNLNKSINTVNSAIAEMKNTGTLTANTMTTLLSEIDGMASKLGKDGTLSMEALIAQQQELADASRQAYIDMQNSSNEYFQNVILADADKKAQMEAQMSAMMAQFGVEYQVDLSNYDNMNQAKADLERRLMTALATAWQQHISQLASKLLAMLQGFQTGLDTVKNAVNQAQVDYRHMSSSEFAGASNYALVDGVSPEAFAKMTKEGSRRYKKGIKEAGVQLDNFSTSLGGASDALANLGNFWKNFDSSFSTPNIDYSAGSGGTTGGYNTNKNKSPSSSGGGSSSKGNKGSSKSSERDKDREAEEQAKAKYTYIKQYYQEVVNDILKGGDNVDKALSKNQALAEKYSALGDYDKLKDVNKEVLALKEKSVTQTKAMDKQLNDLLYVMKVKLQKTNLFEGIDLNKLTESQLAKVKQDLETRIAQADKKKDYETQYKLEQQLALVEEIGGVYLDTLDKRKELQADYYTKELEYLQEVTDQIKKTYERKEQDYEWKDKTIELKMKVLVDDSSLQGNKQAMEDFKQIQQLREQSITDSKNKQKDLEKELQELRKAGYKEEADEIREIKNKWLEAYEERLDKIKEYAEAKRQAEIDSLNYEADEIDYNKGYIKNLLDLTVQMLKQQYNDKKDALKEQYDLEKDKYKKEYELAKKALNDKLDLIKKEADAKKKALKKEQKNRKYNQDLSEKQSEVAKLKAKLDELSLDTSVSGKKKYKEVYKEYVEAVKDLDDLQYDHSVDMQEEAIDEIKDKLEEQTKNELENLEQKYKEEEDLRKKAYEKEKKQYEDLLKKKGDLYKKANELIRNDESQLYQDLKDYALEYTDTTKAEFEDLWTKAYEGLDRYGSKSESVMDILESMTKRALELKDALRDIGNTSYKDYLGDYEDDYNADEQIPDREPDPPKQQETSDYDKKCDERDRKIQKMIDLGQQAQGADKATKERIHSQQQSIASQIGAWWSASKQQWWITIKGKDMPIRDAIGVRHTGLETGEVGGRKGKFKLKANEELNKLQRGEIVLTPKQSENIVENAKKLAKRNVENGHVSVTLDMHDFNVTQDSLKDFKDLIRIEVPKVINKSLRDKGIKR